MSSALYIDRPVRSYIVACSTFRNERRRNMYTSSPRNSEYHIPAPTAMRLMLTALLLITSSLGLARPVLADTFTVSTVADSGPGSPRQAILDANNTSRLDIITFSITGPG